MEVKLFNQTYDDIEQYREYYVVTRSDKYGIVSKTDGSIVIPMDYDALIPVGDNKIVAQKGDKYGIIDFDENIVLPFEYDRIRPVEKKHLFFKEKKIFAQQGEKIKFFKAKDLK